ncbi:sensor histidine kinase [Kitasatospora hibisci]|uniref:sensor histidine kinase n=1 Tax=Kitasatospora hibisci TaxID=3369522 RepID=UPI00375412C6
MTAATRTSGATVRAQAEEALTSSGRGLARLGLLVLGILPVTVMPFVAALMAGGAVASVLDPYSMGELFAVVAAGVGGAAVAALFVRRVARRTRDQLSRWYGMRLPVSYTPRPALERDERGHWWTGYSYHRSHGMARIAQLLHWGLRDRATRAEVLWLAVGPIVVLGLAVPVAALLFLGLGCTFAFNDPVLVDGYGAGSDRMLSMLLNGLLGLGLMAAGVAVAPLAVRAYAEIACRVLRQGDRASHAQLTKRVAELTETRADAVGNQAAELRRIERDLHDGAQARLVAIGMTLGTIEHLMDTDPTAARELLSEARQSSARALQELRDLVRGIHPPVLAERGLGDAVRALALDSALPTEVCVSLPDRPPAPVEAAAYFSICELLANAAKHSGAEQVWVDILYRAGTLRITVTDDGVGVADPTRGTGLRGIERRLGTFDGVLAIDSTSGGPTTITLELPCELSSPRTSTSSVKV